MKDLFRKIAAKTAYAMGTASAFLISCVIVILWAVTGPIFNYSDTWQLYINTGTTVATFLMVFLIQNTQNRDSKSLHLKLDELIRSSKNARDAFLELDDLSDEEILAIDGELRQIGGKITPSSEMRKLHKKIQNEKARRVGIRTAGSAITTMLKSPLSPLTNSDSKDVKKSK